LQSFAQRGEKEAELHEELEFHLAEEIEEREAAGLAAEQARTEARRSLGNVTLVVEDARAVWGWIALEQFGQDLHHAVRGFFRSPGFTIAAVLTIAVGIGGAASIFSVADAVVLRPFVYATPERLVVIWQSDRERNPFVEISYPAFREWRDRAQSFESLAAMPSVNSELTLTGRGEPAVIEGRAVSGAFFSMLGVAPALGRVLLPDDDRPGTAAAVLSHSLWRERFGTDPAVMGQSVILGGRPFTIVGVMPPDFAYPKGAQVWVPLQADGLFEDALFGDAGAGVGWMIALGRLNEGVSLKAAQTELTEIWRPMHRSLMSAGADSTWVDSRVAVLTPFAEVVLGPARPALLAILGASVLVLLIACANVAGLLATRAMERRREMVVRHALGASRTRLLRTIFTESLLLASLGAGGGVAAAFLGTPLMTALSPADIPRLEQVVVNMRAVGFAVGAAVLVAIVSGLAPMALARRATLEETIRRTPARVAEGRSRFRSVLVVSEVALAVVLLVAAGLILRSFFNLRGVPLGFEPESVLTVTLGPKGERYAELAAQRTFYQELLQRVRGLPGVESAAVITRRPLWSTVGYDWVYTVDGQTEQESARNPLVNLLSVSSDYFRTMGTPLVRGRGFTDADRDGQPGVVVISESLARQAWPGINPIGKRLKTRLPGTPYDNVWLAVVGMVADARYRELEAARLDLYVSYLQADHSLNNLMVRTSTDATVVARAVREAVHSVDPTVPVMETIRMADIVSARLGGPRFATRLFGTFAILALALAALGLYTLLAYSVASRTREMGLRMALGAQRADVRRLVVGYGLKLTMVGLLLGLGAALIGGRFIEALVYGVGVRDPLTLTVAPVVLSVVAAGACLLPAVRATRVDPATALRDE
jgi:putative ABC transport system permease protein